MENQEITDAQQTETSDEDVIRTGTPAEIDEVS